MKQNLYIRVFFPEAFSRNPHCQCRCIVPCRWGLAVCCETLDMGQEAGPVFRRLCEAKSCYVVVSFNCSPAARRVTALVLRSSLIVTATGSTNSACGCDHNASHRGGHVTSKINQYLTAFSCLFLTFPLVNDSITLFLFLFLSLNGHCIFTLFQFFLFFIQSPMPVLRQAKACEAVRLSFSSLPLTAPSQLIFYCCCDYLKIFVVLDIIVRVKSTTKLQGHSS